MTVFVVVHPDSLHVLARMEGPGGVLGDLSRRLVPGEFLFGWSYDELRALGGGGHDIEPRGP